ncbi:NUDIX hydrolase [Streptomyces mobaraensis NBRC 13819 = DSM 40847]|uniref:NUDIX hydrolase n=2 Tax=Streptomyces mobaraensis TaxID=35621 RepID=A0A5N5W4S8_STRMB|nr:NUDIX hydrolase [Streptomyces mobaraensis]EME96944.1 putative hydrolase [Streptomyces mobaraensis NBRC 13819 = DSM 40847]KAB7841599.1 NUDIX hydrolase [Streptomyces mobaraensis]QTT72409.1 NUDIX hydrolase [Streptomyces mobaraensis NBRC 13819 = DSM 40847]
MSDDHGGCRGWDRLGTEVLFHGRHLTLHRDRVVQPDGAEGTYERLTLADGARVVAVDDEGWVALVEDAFAPLGRRLLHIPGGAVAAGEDPEAAAARECEEETGRRPGALRRLGAFHPLPSRTSAVTHLYLATDLRRGTLRRDPTEAGMRACWLPLDDAVRLAASGTLTEAGTVTGLLLAARLLSA